MAGGTFRLSLVDGAAALAEDRGMPPPPLHRCPGCRAWTPRTQWAGDGAAGAIDFAMRCPRCRRWVDVAEIDYRLDFGGAGRGDESAEPS